MNKIFIGGSRRVTKLNKTIRERADEITKKGHAVLIGDANGADRAMQQFFAQKRYQHVTVYCAGHHCRNNLGNWNVKYVQSDGIEKDFAFYVRKDMEMCRDADMGFMLWDGKSNGTLNNMLNLIEHDKKVTVYFSPKKLFICLSSMRDLSHLIKNCGSADLAIFENKLGLTKRLTAQQELSLAFNNTR